MRERLFRWLASSHPEGQVLTRPLMLTRVALFPIKWLVWRSEPYDFQTDVWTIHGQKFSGEMLYMLAKSAGARVEIRQQNGCTTLIVLKDT